MLAKLQKSKKEKGFTIIEVLIVLAIAGLILLIVFLAVPALQRNSRNTQRKDDVSRIGSAVQEYINNNGGSKPTSAQNDAIRDLLGKLAYYQNSDVSVVGDATSTSTPANDTTVDQVKIYTAAKCGTSGGNQGAIQGTARQIAIVYSTETGGGNAKLCTDL